MDRITRFAAVNTKIRAMERNFLQDQHYAEMLRKRSIAELAGYLRENTPYRKLLDDINTDKLSRATLERILRRNMVKNLDKLLYFFRGNYKEFLKALYLKYEIEDLKNLARDIYNSSETGLIDRPYAFIGRYSNVPSDKVLKAETLRDLIMALEGSEFDDYVKPLLDGKRENLFHLEMALDTAYFSILKKRSEKLENGDRKILEKWEGMVSDLYNLQWIYRGKKFYMLSPEELLNYTIDMGDRISFLKRRELCYSINLDELDSMAGELGYGFLFKKDETGDIYMERRINRFLFYRLKALLRRSPMSIIQAIAYALFLEFEIKDIISITECIRYNLSPEESGRFLIRAV
ncbi:V-type ATPase subunit [Thermosediminibacter oceani]|uniref:H+transporting two-sector ATPase C (AC39) subunit n=1 Tax=Thermosediminibacter oceani (strain ATCC BAA-1034 / DSM 16646 / JW/IW-1228P) TaxID=555079 RepID=D9RYN0_THEOJ|nr:V-type ATPase subunit [Thermosediminibacter oceani]ADL08454.1 H+transporting two-sector ATPase C (AC39) subunit [Thermosediminibacter oceani DSM 16646]